MAEKVKRPRGGERWRHKGKGDDCIVWMRRSVYPMEGVRSHSDAQWSMVVAGVGHGRFTYMHESDFVKEWEFVRKEPKNA